MFQETEDIIHSQMEFLPLKEYTGIREGNALRIDWNDVVSKEKLNYIMGNPPFVGARLMSSSQKEDVLEIFGSKWKNVGNLDYVTCWYKKSAEMMKDTAIRTALVSTNSVCQGETVANLWKPLFKEGVHIDFAYRTFIWDSEASIKAHVHCVIVGFSIADNKKQRFIWENGNFSNVQRINAYLLDADDVFIDSRSKPISNIPAIGIGNKPVDGGFYLFEKEEMEEFIKKEPGSKKFFRLWYGSREFINRCPRFCLWIGDAAPNEIRVLLECRKRIEAVKKFRLGSSSVGTVKLADRPTHFHVENMPKKVERNGRNRMKKSIMTILLAGRLIAAPVQRLQ